MARHRLKIVALIFSVGLIFFIRNSFHSRTANNVAASHLVLITLDRLATQATLHAQDKVAYPENWISISQLRDDVLRDEHSVRKREALWKKVRNIVEMNANVRSSQRESHNGEISRVWEWIGAVGSFEDGDTRRRRKSGRVSWGAYDENFSPVSGMDDGPRWAESRPIY